MENFVLFNPVKLHFGQGVTLQIGASAAKIGSKALLVMGKGSVKNNDSYRQVTESLEQAGIQWFEYSGIKPNPVIEDVDAAAQLGREKNVDMVIAIGGGSVADSAKIISITIPTNHSGWEFFNGNKIPKKSLPLLCVLTLAATGTEMNLFAVVQNDELKKKLGFGHPLIFPKESFLDPEFTKTVPANHTANGIADLIAHSLEAWFGMGDASLSDKFIIAIIKEALENGPKLMQNPADYLLRAKIMYAATCALNGMTVPGRKSGDWGVHSIGHSLSVMLDIAHGASLTIAYPAWLEIQKVRIPERVEQLGRELFGVSTANETIESLRRFLGTIGCPLNLKEAGFNIDESQETELLEIMAQNGVSGIIHKLTPEDHKRLVELMAGSD
jgi:alcohol dehydrogenase YqhD (iron-dependent ADH family)